MSELDGARFRKGLKEAPDRSYLKLDSQKGAYVEEHIIVPIMAGNEVEEEIVYSVNRFGSVYEYDENTKKLFSYLKSVYGKKILSGQQYLQKEEYEDIFATQKKASAD